MRPTDERGRPIGASPGGLPAGDRGDPVSPGRGDPVGPRRAACVCTASDVVPTNYGRLALRTVGLGPMDYWYHWVDDWYHWVDDTCMGRSSQVKSLSEEVELIECLNLCNLGVNRTILLY